MKQDIRSLVMKLPVFDVHEHHMPGDFDRKNVGLLDLFKSGYAGWTQLKPSLIDPDDSFESDVDSAGREESWSDIAPFIEGSGSNFFVRNLVSALSDLYQLGSKGVTAENWRELDTEIRRRHSSPDWNAEVLAKGGIRHIVTDPFSNPLLDARDALGTNYSSVLRINALAMGWHRDSADHNGNTARRFAEGIGDCYESFDDYLDFLEKLLDTMRGRGQIALKNALAYDRSVNFDDSDAYLARKAWGQVSPSEVEKKAFGDYVVNHLCSLAGEKNIPVQMHLGTGRIRGSHPLNAAGLIERHPETRFLLMHLAYPWSRDLLGMAFVYRNIWIDLTWSALLSPTHFTAALHEAIEILPDESRMMMGGDAWHVEESYGAVVTMKRLIGKVLQEKVDEGYFSADDAERLAGKILHDNAAEFFAESLERAPRRSE